MIGWEQNLDIDHISENIKDAKEAKLQFNSKETKL